MKIIHPRRKLIVNKEVQYDVLMYVSVFVAVVFVAQVISAFFIIHKVESMAAAGEFSSLNVQEFVSRYKIPLLIFEMLPVLLCLVFAPFIFNRLTARIVGPLYNMRRILRRVADNDPSAEIHLREGDYFQDLAQDLNTVIKRTHPDQKEEFKEDPKKKAS
jgi:hypothetical protein